MIDGRGGYGKYLSEETMNVIRASKQPFDLDKAELLDYVITKETIKLRILVYCYKNMNIFKIKESKRNRGTSFVIIDLIANNYTNLKYRLFGIDGLLSDKLKIEVIDNKYKILQLYDNEEHPEADDCFSEFEVKDDYCDEIFRLEFESSDVYWDNGIIYNNDDALCENQYTYLLEKRSSYYHD